MPLQETTTYVLSDDRKKLVATDTTGAYNPATNPTGYGGPNPNPTYPPFSASALSVRIPDTTTFLPVDEASAITIDVSSAFPSSSNGTFDITADLIGGSVGDTIPPGWYIITWNQTYDDGGGEVNTTLVTNVLIWEPIECCINNLAVANYKPGCGCDDVSDLQLNLALASSYLRLMMPRVIAGAISDSVVVECGAYAKAADMLVFMNDLCESNGCSSC